jgi:protein-arginine kinase activator protein McsA
MPVKKGNIPWNKGKSGYETQEQIESRVSKFRGRKHTEQEHIKMSLGHMGHIVSLESRKKQSISRGRHNYIDFSDLRELYINQRLSTPKIAKIKGCGTCVIYTQLRNQGITIRSVTESITGVYNPHYGKTPSEETKQIMRDKLSGENNPFYGRHHTQELKKDFSERFSGEKHPQWLGGISYEPYSPEFNDKTKERIRERDEYKCQVCSKEGKHLDIHHIDYNKKNFADSNLISLCKSCHSKTTHHREYWQPYLTEFMKTKIAT